MVVLKNPREIILMKDAGKISAMALTLAGELVTPGITTKEIDTKVRELIVKHGAKPSFLNYSGYPASICISINDEVIHGIPSNKREIKNGDIVSIDVGACYKGYHGDNAATFPAGDISAEAKKLIDVTRQSLNMAIAAAIPGNRIGDISFAVSEYVESFGFKVVKKFVGHGVGAKLHEEPDVPNFGKPGRGVRLVPGMTIAIEPMINQLDDDVYILDDGWTVLTTMGGLSAHFEHTIAITEDGATILTQL